MLLHGCHLCLDFSFTSGHICLLLNSFFHTISFNDAVIVGFTLAINNLKIQWFGMYNDNEEDKRIPGTIRARTTFDICIYRY